MYRDRDDFRSTDPQFRPKRWLANGLVHHMDWRAGDSPCRDNL